MRWTVALPTENVGAGPDLISAAAIGEMAAALEAAGVDACHVTDHPYPPRAWVEAGGHHALDPLIALSFAAAATRRIRLHTNIFVAAYRHPVLAAHSAATLDVLSGGRLILGTGTGYLREEFEALGVDYLRRGAVLEEVITTMQKVWSGELGNEGNVLAPLPVSQPHPPIWFGGNSAVSMRRAVRLGQGWAPFPATRGLAKATRTAALTDVDSLARAIGDMRSFATEIGRSEPIDICVTPFSHPHHRAALEPERLLDEAVQLARLGVTWLSIRLPAPSRAGFLENVAGFATEVVAQVDRRESLADTDIR
ncbi:MAG: class F420-dependent oxidoreductase [Nocardia sp.]|uniref:TIGR03619 family F420-dependent LLM class oxidoreductase n=1 Tax=Nocardia sp. TaxID=1821 RepID=UPI002606F962|nr:TIGR03619 family F420-dependent LLM class oxidoreductase [Nocardia sp.]MCU1646133.1 class F420-dependent oxidoreductase [Nocardia sp.]